MPRRAVPVALLLLLAAAGCGKSKERELFEQRQAACGTVKGLVVTEVRRALRGSVEALVTCSAALARIEGDTCGGGTGSYDQPVCQIAYQWAANDPALCSPRSCIYFCEVRFDEADVQQNGDAAIACAARFLPPQ